MPVPAWLYWEGEKPAWIQMCRDSVYNHVSEVNVVSPEDFAQLRTSDRDIDLEVLCVEHRADFIRAYLLANFGGFWIDADCLVMKSLAPLFEKLEKYEFIGYRERSGYVTNNFMGVPENSRIARAYYQNICTILRSGQPLEWLTLGSHALTATLAASDADWYELETRLIQPVCWSEQETFFKKRGYKEHKEVFDKNAYCYMLAANMANDYQKENPSLSLLEENTFFHFLGKQSRKNSLLSKIKYRENTDDDIWVLPEVMESDMYRIEEALSLLAPASPAYIVDCGAHIGAFSIMCAGYLPHLQVISFEPNPDSFEYLMENTKLYGNITALNKAVDIKAGLLNLYSPGREDWTGRWTALPNGNNAVSVEAVDIFSFLKNLDAPVFILKLDLEGYEEYIVNNSREEDLAGVQILIVETHTPSFDHAKLLGNGYTLLFKPDISTDRQFVYAR